MLDILEKKLTESPTTIKGLTAAEAEKRLSTDGENRLAKKKKTSAAKIFAGQFHDVMVMILLVSVVISVALGQYADAVPIVLIVIINAALGFIQEYRCEKTLEKLENMTAPTAMVYRDGRLVKIPAAEVVAGDVFTLEAGDRVPCDGYINSSRALSCDESALTGEAVPAVKRSRTSEIDFTALVTGMLLAFNLPVTMPYWQAAIGTFVAIVIVKQLFGGLGQNFANPAIVGRIVLMLAFTGNMTHWVVPFYDPDNIVTGATPLAAAHSAPADYLDLFLGRVGGCLGEVSAAALLIGGVYLIMMKIISVHTPLAFIGTVFVFSYLCGEDGIYQILAGGVMLGAFFMATDYVTTPVTKTGKVIFGIGCGIITCVIRFFGSYPEGVSFSILLMNILTPYIDMITKTKPLGAITKKKEAKSE